MRPQGCLLAAELLPQRERTIASMRTGQTCSLLKASVAFAQAMLNASLAFESAPLFASPRSVSFSLSIPSASEVAELFSPVFTV